MGKIQRTTTANRRQGRRWRFASAVFDEGTWSLTVDGRPAPVEGKPLELLHELLLHAGELVSKDELLDAVWPHVSVVEASLPTAVLKLRRALNDDGGEEAIIETAPRIGYRLKAAVKMDFAGPRLGQETAQIHRRALEAGGSLRWLLAAGGVTLTLALGATLAALTTREPAKAAAFSQEDAKNAIRKLDLARVEELLRVGWNPNTPFDTEGNGALNILLGVCEWDPGHDRKKLVLMAKTLMDAGVRLDAHNVWGDTPYSIAKAPRYCGPDHPVTQMIRTECYAGYRPLGDRCLEDYRPRPKAE
jgi:DNA-binding winged helix-turn-helix (wHTH) protein